MMCIHHLTLTGSPFGGHVGCFHILVTVDDATVNLCVNSLRYLVEALISALFTDPEGELLDHVVILFLTF